MAFDPVRTLGDVVTLVRGTTYKSAQLGQPGPVLLGLGTIQRNGGFRADSLKTYGGDSKEKLLLRPGDIYVSLKDVTQSADLLGAVACVPETIALGRLTQDTVKLEFIDQSYPRSLVYWALRSPEFRAYCRAHATGTTNLGLAREDFLAFKLPEPDEELLSLVELLESLDARIDLLRQSNATLEAIAQALFKSWFVDFDPVRAKAEGREPGGLDAETATLFPCEFEESELGLIPKGWGIGRIGDFCVNVRSQARPEELSPETAYLGLEHMPRGSIALDEFGRSEGLASGKFWYQRGDVLFGKLRPYFHKVGVAPSAGVCSTDILVIRPKTSEYFGFTAMHLSSRAVVEHATQVSNGAKMPRCNWADLDGFRVPAPPLGLLRAFNDLTKPMVDVIQSNVDRSKILADLRDTVLPRLISGKLRLPDVDSVIEEALA